MICQYADSLHITLRFIVLHITHIAPTRRNGYFLSQPYRGYDFTDRYKVTRGELIVEIILLQVISVSTFTYCLANYYEVATLEKMH